MTLLHKVLAASDEDAEEERLMGEMPGKFLVILLYINVLFFSLML